MCQSYHIFNCCKAILYLRRKAVGAYTAFWDMGKNSAMAPFFLENILLFSIPKFQTFNQNCQPGLHPMKRSILSFIPVSNSFRLFTLLGITILCKIHSANAQLISKISTSTGHPYAVSTLRDGALIYTDRTYLATSVPAYLSNASFIKTPNNDKYTKSSMSFKLSQNAIVYIGYDPRATALPTWLQSWQKLPEIINITDPDITHLDIFSKAFPAGTVTLGGNVASPAADVHNMNIVVAVPNTAPNIPPDIQVTYPFNNAFIDSTTVTINAFAEDKDGAITKVDFYNGTTLLGTDKTSPYSYTWKNVPAGEYSLSARATDNGGLATLSTPVFVTVTTPVKYPPTINITDPGSDTTYSKSPATIVINTDAADVDGTISKVDFYKGTTLLGTDKTSPYSFTWNKVGSGSYSITAKATDNDGLSTVSSVRVISVATPLHTPPSVSIISPSNDSVYISVPAKIKLIASATAYNSTIKKVQFYKGATQIKSESSAPYEYTLSNVAVGNYVFTAKATDSKGLITTSDPISVSVRNRPSVTSVNPANNATNVDRNGSISTNVLKLPNGGTDNSTITSANVYLTENATGILVPSNVNGTAGGDAITLVPSGTLKMNTVYRFTITAGVTDLAGIPFVPFTSTFTTNSVSSGFTTVQFERVALPNTSGRHTCVTIGPDRKLYALQDDGLIKRYIINAGGTLTGPELIYSLQDSYGQRHKTLAIGLTFDPSSTANNLIAWITHCNTYVFTNAPDWDGKLTKLSGSNLQNVQDVLINLPRSAKDHVTNSIAFGPDGALYYTQGSCSAMGRADQTWNLRNEHLLSGAVMRLDLTKLGALPLDAKTSEGGGTYNPYAPNAPLTIYASGVRNSYDLVWHSNGNLYVATNGSAAGGNTPASIAGTLRPDGSTYNGPSVPALSNIQQTMEDFLYRIVKGGYYGHPNPVRGEYVMNGGNPTSQKDSAEVPSYPVGTLPDANWRGNVYNFKNNISPNGFIEYKSNAFNGALKGKLIFVRYSAHDDLITLTPGPNNNIIAAEAGATIPGFTGFVDPLDLTEDVTTGNLYVSEYGGDSGKITLVRPTASLPVATAKRSSREVMSTPDRPINTISGCDAGIEVVIDEDKTIALSAIQRPRINPNPVQKKFTIQFPNSYEGEYALQIVDVSGRVYQVGKINLKGGTNMAIDISKLSLKAGTYFLKIIPHNKKSEVFKLSVISTN